MESDNPVPESELDGEQAFAAFLSKNMDEDGRIAPVPQAEEEEQQTEEPEAQAAEEVVPKQEDTPEEPEYEVKVKGEVKKVKQSDLIAGYQKAEDYTQKTMQLAEERRSVEAAAQQAAQERQYYLTNLQQMQAQLAQAVKSGAIAEPDPGLIQTDPVAYLEQKERYEQARKAWDQMAQEQQVLVERQRQEDVQRYSQTLVAQKEQLLAKLPEWKDQTKMQTEVSELKKFLKSEGYSEGEVDGIVDARAVALARKAWMYDKLMSNKQAVEQKVKQAPPKAIPRSGTQSDPASGPRLNQSAAQRLKSTGDVRDAAAVFRSLMR